MLRLSEAIRLGSTLRPQAFGKLRSQDGSCALGAAAEACGINIADIHCWQDWPPEWRITLGKEQHCPECARNMSDGLVAHLNDAHCWTRERIASFVEQIENQQPQEQPESMAEPCLTCPDF